MNTKTNMWKQEIPDNILLNPHICKITGYTSEAPHYNEIVFSRRDDNLCDYISFVYTNNKLLIGKPMTILFHDAKCYPK